MQVCTRYSRILHGYKVNSEAKAVGIIASDIKNPGEMDEVLCENGKGKYVPAATPAAKVYATLWFAGDSIF